MAKTKKKIVSKKKTLEEHLSHKVVDAFMKKIGAKSMVVFAEMSDSIGCNIHEVHPLMAARYAEMFESASSTLAEQVLTQIAQKLKK